MYMYTIFTNNWKHMLFYLKKYLTFSTVQNNTELKSMNVKVYVWLLYLKFELNQ